MRGLKAITAILVGVSLFFIGGLSVANAADPAPVVDVATYSFPAIDEDCGETDGTLVSTMVSGSISYSNENTGIAITQVDNSNGTWKYSTGSYVYSIPATVSESNSFVLSKDQSILFVPDGNFFGVSTIQYRGYSGTQDQVSGIDTTTNGGETDISTGIVTATVTVNSINDVPVITDDSTDKILNFDGTNEYVKLDGSIDLDESFTVEMWTYWNVVSGDFQNWSRIFDFSNPDDGTYSDDSMDVICGGVRGEDGESFFTVEHNTNSDHRIFGMYYPENVWIHLAFVYDFPNEQGLIYLNGELATTTKDLSDGRIEEMIIDQTVRQNNYFGRSAYVRDSLFRGKMRDVRIWEDIRTPAEILANINSTLNGDEADLVGYYKMNDGSGTVVANSATDAGALPHGTLTSEDDDGAWETLSGITSVVSTTENTQASIQVFISDIETNNESLEITFSSSDTAVISNTNITYTQNDDSCLIKLQPEADATGNSVITVNVNDGITTTSEEFAFQVVEKPTESAAIHYDGNATEASAPGDTIGVVGESVTITNEVPTLDGYRFINWNTESGGGGTTYNSGGMIDTLSGDITLFAQWIQEFEIEAVSNGNGTISPSGTVEVDAGNDQSFTFTPDIGFEVTDIVVDGSSEEPQASYNFTSVSANHTINVTFGLSSYTVDFDDNAEDETITKTSSQTITHDGIVSEPTDPTRTGYTFGGWYKESACTNAWDFVNDTVTSNTTLYAEWTIDTFTVSYDENGATGGTTPWDDNSPYDYNSEVTVFGNAGLLSKTGYSFNGWNTESGGGGAHYDGTDEFTITENTILYAQWAIENYTVTYNANGATDGEVPTDSSQYEYDTEVTVIGNTGSLERTGYTFKGWDTKTNGTGISYVDGDIFDIASNTVLYADWEPVSNTVTLNKQSGTGGTSSVSASYGSAMPSAAAPTRTGYDFGGYYTAINGGGTQYYDADMTSAKTCDFLTATTLYAKWTIKTHIVTYSSNGGTSGSVPTDSSSPYNYNSTVTVLDNTENLSKTGHDFNGWNTEDDGSGTDYDADDTFTITSDTTLYAQWTIASYTVKYNSNSATTGSTPTDSDSPYIYNTEVTVLSNSGSLKRTGYTFGGWNTKADGSGTSYSANDTFNIASDTTLYAKWTGNKYTVTLNKQSGTSGSSSVVATYGSAMPSATAPTRAGYTFGGYYTSINGNGTKYYNADMTSAKTYDLLSAATLYAQWTQDTYAVTYNSNGATSGSVPADASSPYTYYQTVTVLGNTGSLAIANYTFIGWNTTSTGSGTHYDAGDTFAIYASTTLYAEWEADAAKVDLTYNTNDATSGSAPTDSNSPYTVGSTVTVLGNTGSLSRTGYTFEGWNTKSDGSGTDYESGDIFTISSETTLYANWTANQYTVTFDKRYGSGGTSSVAATYDSAMPSASAPSRSGYSFGGYYTEKYGNGTRYYNYKMTSTRDCDFTQDITLYANWTYYSSDSSETDDDDDDEDSDTIYTSEDEDIVDTDGDGVSDEDEEEAGSEPDDADSTPSDIDGNGVVDSPFADTDEDSIMDGDEVKYGSDPDNPDSTPSDVDGNGVVDDPYTDTDKDGVTDGDEAKAGSDPDDADSVPSDINGDGVVDRPAVDTDNDGMSDSLEITLGSDPYDGKSTPLDMDGNGIVDKPFADSDGDGISDSLEVAFGSDPYDEKSAPPEKDSNAAGSLAEVDSDNDGISDRAEKAVGSDPDDSSDKPNIGTVTGKIIDASKSGMQGVKLVLYSTPKEVTTDANGEFNFNDVSLSTHTLSIYMKDIEVGRYDLKFSEANENAIRIDDDASSDGAGIINVSTNSDLAVVEVVLQKNENGLFEISDTDFEEVKDNRSDNNRLLLWIIIISVILLGALVYLLLTLKRRSKYYD